MRAGLIAMAGAALIVAGCSQQAAIRIFDTIAGYSCIVSERVIGAEPCPVDVPPTAAPLFCHQTIAGVECYAEDDPFRIEPGWERAGAPDIGG
jgi:hypothetical protein